MNIPIAFEDDWLLVADKPSGLLVIPTPKKESRTLTSILNTHIKEKEGSLRLHPCHRLDRETSGLVIYAKGKSIQKKMMDAFKFQRVKKTYIAFVQGVLSQNNGRITLPIEQRPSVTSYQVLERRKNFTVVKAWPLTGRTNQIRIHFKSIGHPLLGESRFAFRRDYELRFKRTCLHAASVEFSHPVTGEKIKIEAELPGDLLDFLARPYH
ncbi:MAG: RluA family pseudouridine synthase [Candidatus Omnitrophota bacterium]